MKMTVEELRTQHPELEKQIIQEAVIKERKRIQDIDDIASMFDPSIVFEAKYGPNRCTAEELAYRAAKQKIVPSEDARIAAGEAATRKIYAESN